MNDFVDKATSLLTRRFVLNAFLPVLVAMSSALGIVLVANGSIRHAWVMWTKLDSFTQAGLILGWLATIWFLAGVLISQFRNITQVYEGYPLTRAGLADRIGQYYASQHYMRSLRMKERGRDDDAAIAFPDLRDDFMPTRLGNVLRASEYYGDDLYKMPFSWAWPRLATLVPDRYRQDIEEFRTDFEWLLALSALGGVFGTAIGVVILATSGPWWVFLASFGGGWIVAFVAYRSAVTAAEEYGVQLRVAVDLYRLDLIQALGWAIPKTLVEEQQTWTEIAEFHRRLRVEVTRPTYAPHRPIAGLDDQPHQPPLG